MKFALVSREFPPDSHVGGIGTYTDTAAKLLIDYGHEVHVLCLGRITTLNQSGKLFVHQIAMNKHPLPSGRIFFPLRKFIRNQMPNFLDALTWALTVAHYVRQCPHFDSIDAWEWPETNGEGAFLPRDRIRGKGICRIHTSWLENTSHHPLESRALIYLQRRSCHLARKVVSPSEAMGNRYARQILKLPYPVLASVNPLKFWNKPMDRSKKTKLHWLFVGRIEYRKGLDVLLKAIQQLPPQGETIELRIIGAWNPPYISQDQIVQEMLWKTMGMNGTWKTTNGILEVKPKPFSQGRVRIEYLGPKSHEDLCDDLDWAGLLLMPTRMDNYPYVLLEAMSRGCCLIASDVGGVKEICPNQPFAEWVPAGNADSLAQKMREWLNNSADPSNLWDKAVGYAEDHFGEEAGYRRLMDLYAKGNSEL